MTRCFGQELIYNSKTYVTLYLTNLWNIIIIRRFPLKNWLLFHEYLRNNSRSILQAAISSSRFMSYTYMGCRWPGANVDTLCDTVSDSCGDVIAGINRARVRDRKNSDHGPTVVNKTIAPLSSLPYPLTYFFAFLTTLLARTIDSPSEQPNGCVVWQIELFQVKIHDERGISRSFTTIRILMCSLKYRFNQILMGY